MNSENGPDPLSISSPRKAYSTSESKDSNKSALGRKQGRGMSTMQGSERRLEARIEALEERERRRPSQADKAFAKRATRDTFEWVTKHTRTYNEHWQKEGRPRPDEQYMMACHSLSHADRRSHGSG